MAHLFTCISFQHVGRVGNDIAHNLARHARHVTGFSEIGRASCRERVCR